MDTGRVIGTKMRILLVDDEEVLRTAIKRGLEKEGHEVRMAVNGSEAQALVAVERFDLVLSDVHMPATEVGGLELLQYIKKHHPMPVVLMTGFSASSDAQEKSAHLGADGFLIKPFKKADLLLVIQKACANQC